MWIGVEKNNNMWQYLIVLIGFSLLYNNATVGITTFVGDNVNMTCNATGKNLRIVKLIWKQSDDTTLFVCDRRADCRNHIIKQSLGSTERLISILNIPNVSLDQEDEYTCVMTILNSGKKTCAFNLTVNVPPSRLVLVDGHGKEIPQNERSLSVAGGENKTVVCKTNTSVKPAVDLEWLIPKELIEISEYGEQIQDEQDERLFVSLRKLSFTPNYTFDEDLSLVCKVASKSSSERIQTLIYLRYKGNSDVSSTPMTTVLISLAGDNEQDIWPIIAGSSSGVILLLVLATIGIVIRSRKMAVRGPVKLESTRDATQPRPFQSRGSLPPPPSDQSSLTASHLPDRQPSPTRSFRPAPPVPPEDIPMRQMVPVSDDTTGSTSTNNRLREATSRGACASRPATHSQRGLDTDMEYDVLNDTEYDVLNMEYAVVDKTPSKAHEAVPHVYRETTDGLAEYALVSRPKMGKNALQPRFHNTERLDAEFEYAVVDKSHRMGRESVPHIYTQTMSGLEEYAVVNKPKDRKKRQSEVRHTTAPGDFEAEYAVVDKWKKN